MKKAGIFNPYWDTLGGGEKYTASVAAALLKDGYQVEIYWKDPQLSQKIDNRFGIDIGKSIIRPIKPTQIQQRKLDLIFWVSDGSLPFLFGKRNILHFQVPFTTSQTSLLNRIKLKTIYLIVCNSHFTKQVIDKTYRVNSRVLYPPCSKIVSGKKEKMILSVGRFDGLLHNKRQDILIDAFKRLQLSDWKLVLAGGDMGQTDNLKRLRELAVGAAIDFEVNPNRSTIEKLYGNATLYWHAAGFGVDEQKEPEKTEHFGIATVEAMSAGAVPLVYQAGGQTEIVQQKENGFLWTSVDELVEKSYQLINDTQLLEKVATTAVETSKQFSMERFIHDFTHICIR